MKFTRKEIKIMKRQIRRGVFETNSSSTHSLVMCSEEEFEAWKKKNPKEKPITYDFFDKLILEVGDCGGFTEELRAYLTDNQDDLIGNVIEVKAHEVLKTGKLRHPRFIRMRDDKDSYQCTYLDHMRG